MAVTPPSLTELLRVFRQKESGGRPSAVSPVGARGSLQIMPGTFAQHARPGESFEDPLAVELVAERYFSDVYQRHKGDPGRMAVEWYSGPGNVAPASSQAPYRRNLQAQSGPNVGEYVRDVWKRVGEWEVVPPQAEDWEVVASGPDEWEVVEPAAAAPLRRAVNPADLVEPR